MTQSGGRTAGEVPATLLQWTVQPARQRPWAALGAVVAVLLATALLHAVYRLPSLTALGALLLAGAVAEFVAPSRYILTSAGAVRQGLAGPRRIDWAAVRRVYLFEHGLKLSPLATPGAWESWRGLFLPFGDQGEQVRELVDHWAAARLRPEAGDADAV